MSERRSSALSKPELHTKIVMALGSNCTGAGDTSRIPFLTQVGSMGAIGFYAFTMTTPHGGRPMGEFKVQLIVPGQGRANRGALDFTDGAFLVIAGWSPEEDVFALWDAYAHQEFAYSQNLQVGGRYVWEALTRKITYCRRTLRAGRGIETVVVCPSDQLFAALRERIRLSAERLQPKQ